MKTYLRLKWRGRIGYIKEGVFYSQRSSRFHAFRKYGNGFGLSLDVLSELNIRNIHQICIIVDHTEHIFASVEDFYLKGKKYIDTKDGIEDLQYILPLEEFSQEKKIIEYKQVKLA